VIPFQPLAAACLAYLCSDPFCRSRVNTNIPNDPNAHCLYWSNPAVVFTQSALGNPATGPSALVAVSTAWNNWESVAQSCGSVLQISEAAHSTSRQVGYNPNGGNENLALFRQTSCTTAAPSSDACWQAQTCNNVYDCWVYSAATIALTTTTYDKNTGILYDADIEFNSADFIFTTVNSPPCLQSAQNQTCVATDVQNTITHETGFQATPTLGLIVWPKSV